LSIQNALQHLADVNLKGLSVTNEGIVRENGSRILVKLIEWVKAGGTVIVGAFYSAERDRRILRKVVALEAR